METQYIIAGLRRLASAERGRYSRIRNGEHRINSEACEEAIKLIERFSSSIKEINDIRMAIKEAEMVEDK